jgi:hypothetical protein
MPGHENLEFDDRCSTPPKTVTRLPQYFLTIQNDTPSEHDTLNYKIATKSVKKFTNIYTMMC